MGNGKIEWVSFRINIPKDMAEDIDIIHKECGINKSDFVKPRIREAIESMAHYLPVGSNRKKDC